jgi:hypothetical protein
MAEHYDVIIIGTGAGGGTLAHTLAPSGKKILLLERGNYLPREMATWDAQSVFVDGRYISKDTWYDADGSEFQPQVHYFVGGRDQALRRRALPAAAGRLRGPAPRRRPVARVAAHVRRLRAVLHACRMALPGPRQPRRGPHRRALEQAVPVAGRVARGTDRATLRRSPICRLPPVPRAMWGAARRSRTGEEQMHPRCTSCDGYPCLVHAKSDAETIAVRPILDLPNVTLLVNAEVRRLRTDATGGSVTGVDVSRGGRRCTTPTWSWCRPAPGTVPSSCCARRAIGTRTDSPTAPTR